MKCDSCDQEATVFLTQIIHGKMTQVNLCENCSREKGVTDPKGFQLADFLLQSPSTPVLSKSKPESDEILTCPACNFTRNDLKATGRLGCPECYSVFRDDLDHMLRAMHKGTKHVGKTPGQHIHFDQPTHQDSDAEAPTPTPLSKEELQLRLQKMRAQIEKAIQEERYEDAARFRDEIRDLEAES